MVGGVPTARLAHVRGCASVVLFGSTANITKLSRHGKSIGVVRTLTLARALASSMASPSTMPLLCDP
jgi:hypothetical protein